MYPKDMRLFTIFLLIAQVLFLIEQKQFAQATELIDRLKNYANRQLKREDFVRLIAFIRLLQQAAKAEFKRDELVGTEKYLQRFAETPYNYRGLTDEMEVIPYEQLWTIVMKRMR